MDDDRKVSNALSATIASEHLGSLVKDAGEVAIDAMLDNDVLKDIPVVSSLVNIVNAAKHIREHYLARKLFILVTDAGRIPKAERVAFGHRVAKDQKAKEELFELVVHVLDEIRSAERVKMVSALFAALIRGALSEASFRRLCDMVRYLERSHIDLMKGLQADKPTLITRAEIQLLALHGLVAVDFTPHSDGHGLRYVRTVLGTELLTSLESGETV